MEFTIIAELKTLFLIEKPIVVLTEYAEDMFYAIQNFERKYPEWKILNIN